MTDISALTTDLQLYLFNNGSRLPDYLQPLLADSSSINSPIQRLYRSSEALYAVRGNLNDPGRMIVIATFTMLSDTDMFGVNRDNRAQNIIAAMKRDMPMKHPTGGVWPDPKDDPAPLPEFAAPVADIIADA